MKKFLILGLLLIVVLGGCAPAKDQEISEEQESPLVTIYRSPT